MITDTVCDGCQRNETHKMCPAWGTPFYCSGIPYPKEIEDAIAEMIRCGFYDAEKAVFDYLTSVPL